MSDKDREALEAFADVMMNRVRHEMAHMNGDDSECPSEEVGGCELLEDGEFNLGADDLYVDVLRDGDGDPAHIRACWSLGGPSAFLIRDWDGDRLEVSWGFDSTVRRSREVRHLLDAYAEMLTY